MFSVLCLPQRTEWGFAPPAGVLVTIARLRRLVTANPDVDIRHEFADVWIATIPSSANGSAAETVTGADLPELVDELEVALERRVSVRAALATLRAAWSDSYTIWRADREWWFRRRDGVSGPCSAPSAEAVGKLIAEDYAFRPVGSAVAAR